MLPSFSKHILLIIFIIGIISTGRCAQETDHLSMSLDFDDSTIYIRAEYKSIIREYANSIDFLLNPGLELDTIISEGLSSYTITQKEGVPLPFWHLKFHNYLKINDELNVVFNYKINLSEQNHMKSNWIELNADKLWFPNKNSLNNEITYDVSITNFPKSYRLITHMDAEITQEENSIIIRKDTPWYEVLIIAGKEMKEWNYNDTITVIGNDNIPDSTIQSLGDKVKNSIDLLNSSIGKADPIMSFNVVLRNTTRAELGFQFNRKNMIVTGTDYNDYGNLSHEIAHYWWSGADFINEPWMNESFANYCMYLVLETYGLKDYEKVIDKTHEIAKNAIPVMNASLFAANAYNSYYHKGALHLKSLEDRIGSKRMKQLLSTCVEKRIYSTELFLDELEKLTNNEDRSFFEELLKM